MTNAAIAGAVDHLHGLKENVIIGHMIPAGTGMRKYQKVKLSDSVNADLDERMNEILELRRQEKEMESQMSSEMMVPEVSSNDED